MIKSYGNKDTERLADRRHVKRLGPDVQRQALRKLQIIEAATDLNDLRVPPGNRLEKLSGDRSGQHSIRVNDQWRICFRWRNGNAHDVQIVDHH